MIKYTYSKRFNFCKANNISSYLDLNFKHQNDLYNLFRSIGDDWGMKYVSTDFETFKHAVDIALEDLKRNT